MPDEPVRRIAYMAYMVAQAVAVFPYTSARMPRIFFMASSSLLNGYYIDSYCPSITVKTNGKEFVGDGKANTYTNRKVITGPRINGEVIINYLKVL